MAKAEWRMNDETAMKKQSRLLLGTRHYRSFVIRN